MNRSVFDLHRCVFMELSVFKLFSLVIFMVYLGVFSGDYLGLWLVIIVVNLSPSFYKGVQIWVVELLL